jgi:hypothetical protein
MTPKEKAEELILKYLRIDNNTSEWFNTHIAKQCALIAIDEVIDACEINMVESYNTDWWNKVKNEINN